MKEGRKSLPTPFQRFVCWSALCGVCLVVLVMLVAGFLGCLGWLFVALEPVLLPVVVAGVLAYLLSPAVSWMQRWVKSRLWAVLTVLCFSFLALCGLGAAIVPPLVQQTGEMVEKRHEIVERAVETGHDLLENNAVVQRGVDMLYKRVLQDARSELSDEVRSQGQAATYTSKVAAIFSYNSSYLTEKLLGWLTAGSRAISGAAFFLIGAVMVPVFLFYFLWESESIKNNWHTVLPLRQGRFRWEVVETLQQINGYVVAFVRGQMLVSLIDALLLGVALKILGLPYAITIAAAAALLGIIPYIGMISTCIPALLIAWFAWGDWQHVVAVLVIFFSVSQFDGWVIQPKVVGNRVGMHDMTVMFSVLFWSSVLGGVVGALLAVPLTAAIKVLFTRYVWSSLHGEETHQTLHKMDKSANS